MRSNVIRNFAKMCADDSSTSMEIAARDILSSQGYVGALQQACEAAMDVHR